MSKKNDARSDILLELFAIIDARRGDDPETSRTAKLFERGVGRIAQKVGEEATETIVAALSEGREALISESADLLYHLLVLWAASDVKPEDVFAELVDRAVDTNQHKPW